MSYKVVYKDGDYTKVVYGDMDEDDHFLIMTNLNGKVTRVGKPFVISVEERRD